MRTRDRMWFSNPDTMSEILSAYHFTAQRFVENDGSVTLSLNEIDLVENGKDNRFLQPHYRISLKRLRSLIKLLIS